MKKNSTAKKIICLILALGMIFLSSCGKTEVDEESSTGEEESQFTESYGSTTENVTKSETVYVNLDNYGSPKSITVSDWIHADKSQVYIKDKTTLTDFSVTKGQASSVNNNGEVTWQMATSDVYYEGKTDKELPVDINIKYYLDGKETSPEELTGKSGSFKMEVSMKNKISKEVEINGQKVTMYTPIMAIGGVVLSYDNFSNIEVTNGLSIGGGSYEVVVLAGAPGLNESLNLSGLNISGFEDFSFPETFTITATVTDFRFSDTYYALVPLSSLDLNVDLPKTLEDVKNILSEIQNLQDILDQIDPDGALIDFVTNGTSLSEMMDIMQKAISMYQENEALFKAMSQYLTPENIRKLSDFLNSMDTEQMQSLINVMSNVPALQSMVDSLLQLSTGIDEIMPILEGFSTALEDPEVAAALENLPETLETLDELMNYLNDNKEVLDVLTNLLSSEDMSQFTDALDGMIAGSEVNAGDTDISQLTGDAKELVLRMDEWLKFSYDIYTDAPDYMETSCMFICKTDPIG